LRVLQHFFVEAIDKLFDRRAIVQISGHSSCHRRATRHPRALRNGRRYRLLFFLLFLTCAIIRRLRCT
jgi:hypothetical protein